MPQTPLVAGAVLVFSLAMFTSRRSTRKYNPPVSGHESTVLFITDCHNGLSNVHVATCFALLENHPSIEVHYASFPKLAPEIERISFYATARNPASKPIQWHELKGPDHAASTLRAVENSDDNVTDFIRPGLAGINVMMKYFSLMMSPWSAEEHWSLYCDISGIIRDVNPAVVILDQMLRPAWDAARDLNRVRATMSPNALTDTFLAAQPWGAMFWKYPVIGSGLPFPIPWKLIPVNMYLWARLLLNLQTAPDLRRKRSYLKEKGVKDPLSFSEARTKDVPWISMSFPEAGIPLDVIPDHVICCGPIVLDVAPAEIQDRELASWLTQAPTMLINLGAIVKYDEQMAKAIANSLTPVMNSTNVQVLWKFRKVEEYSDSYRKPLEPYIQSGRIRIESWLKADPTSLLKTGHIAVSVHHGGANCYYETVLAGVPHVILPLWFDLYNFARTAEYLGVGLWPGKGTAPRWEPETLSRGFMEVLVGEKGAVMREKARVLGEVARRYGGRDAAAMNIAKMAVKDG